MENAETNTRKYSWLAIAVMVGVPALAYLFAASESSEMREWLNEGAAPSEEDFAVAASLFLIRIGSMVVGALGAFRAAFSSPKETAPKWMVRG